jgi:SOS response regulatory protein OraA/RecX
MGLSEQETARDRLARAAAALAEAEGVAGVRAGGASSGVERQESTVRGADSTRTEPPTWAVARSDAGTADRGGSSTGGSSGGSSGRSSGSSSVRSVGSGRRGRGRAKPRSGWGSDDAGERPEWAPPPEDPEVAVPEADAESVARAIVLRQLSMAPRSRAQLEKKLRQRGCEDDVAARVLDRLTEVGLVDDEAYAQMLVRAKQSDKGLARRALAHELRKQGIDQEIADEALGQVGAGDERLRAEQLVAKKLRSMRGLAPDVQTRRLAGLLARKGYSGEVAWPIIRDAVDGLPEHRRD